MNVFVSWSGQRARAVANALHTCISVVLQRAEPWVSDKDIEAGTDWFGEIRSQLAKSDVGIICVTPENARSHWLHFEAGAIAKQHERARVIPFCFDIEPDALGAPLSLLHAVRADQEGALAMLKTINSALGDNALATDTLERAFTAWWPQLERALSNVSPHSTAPEKPSDRDLLEQILYRIKALPRSNSGSALLASTVSKVMLLATTELQYLESEPPSPWRDARITAVTELVQSLQVVHLSGRISEAIASGQTVTVPGFGTFGVRSSKTRRAKTTDPSE